MSRQPTSPPGAGTSTALKGGPFFSGFMTVLLANSMPRCQAPGRLLALVLVLLVLGLFGSTCGNDFINYDDDAYVTDNTHVLGGLSATNIRWAWTTFHAANWHPLTWLSLELDGSLYGAMPFGYHLDNVLWHSANTLLLYLLLWRLTGAIYASAMVAGLFALHPLHVESVAWVAERKDVLSTFFFLATLGAYAGYVRQPGMGRYALVLLFLMLGLLAKPMLVTLPAVLLLLDFWPLRRFVSDDPNTLWHGGRLLRMPAIVVEKLPMLVLVAGSCVATLLAQSRGGAVHSLGQLSLSIRIENAIIAYVAYLKMILAPVGLIPFYPHRYQPFSLAAVAGAAICLGGVTVLAIRMRRHYPYVFVGWLWYLVTLLPVIGVVQVGRQALADRYTYLPSVGLFVAAVWSIRGWLLADVRLALPLGACLLAGLIACIPLTWIQARYWHDSVTLWTHTLQVMPENYLAHYNLGVKLDAQGDRSGAMAQYADAVHWRPNYSEAHDRWALDLQAEGRWREALEHYQEAVRSNPRNPYAAANLAQACMAQKDLADAHRWFSKAVELDPDMAPAQNGLGIVLMLEGKIADALPHLQAAAKLKPRVGKYHYDLAHCALALGQDARAAAQYQEGIRLDPHWPQVAARTAWTLAASAKSEDRSGLLAVYLALVACESSGYREVDALDALAAAYAEDGRFDKAAEIAHNALGLLPATDRRHRQIRDRAFLYAAHRPFRDVLPALR